jgi:peptide chain release factor subunit 1
LADWDRREPHDSWIVLGTEENVKQFREYLTAPIEERVVHSAAVPIDASDAEILARLTPFITELGVREEATTIDVLRDRLNTGHYAIAGVSDTLASLQLGRVGTLVIARDFHKDGAQCTRCGFLLDRHGGNCPYCGGALRQGVDLVESMIRLATSQEVDLEFVDPRPLAELKGVGALLKF